MCSISGFLSAAPLSHQGAMRLMRSLLYYGRSRGQQSTGLALLTSTGIHLFKQAADPDDFVFSEAFEALFANLPTNTQITGALGHTRQPTCGGRGDDQAQPFVNNNTATVHNGYYHDFAAIKSAHEIDKPSGVDSELVCSYISKHGISTLPTFIASTDGPSAIACYHEGSMYLMRSGNPTVLASFPLGNSNKITVFASTADQLTNALRYCWLFHATPSTSTPTEGLLYQLTPSGLVNISTSPVSYTGRVYTPSSSSQWRGPSGDWTPPSYSSSRYNRLHHHCPSRNGTIVSWHDATCRCNKDDVVKLAAAFQKELEAKVDAATGKLPAFPSGETLTKLLMRQRNDPASLTEEEWLQLANYWTVVEDD